MLCEPITQPISDPNSTGAFNQFLVGTLNSVPDFARSSNETLLALRARAGFECHLGAVQPNVLSFG